VLKFGAVCIVEKNVAIEVIAWDGAEGVMVTMIESAKANMCRTGAIDTRYSSWQTIHG
jgi:hypothetical protein